MWSEVRRAVMVTVVLTIVTGIVYPLLVTALAKRAFPFQAGGSLIVREGRVIGSDLIAQNFSGGRYFHPRPSAAGAKGYDATASGGSNLGPTDRRLIERVAHTAEQLQRENGPSAIPVDLVTASGSGLDPHITPAAAEYQLARVARARGVPEEQIRAVLHRYIEGRQFGVLGESRVNVLRLNLALDHVAAQ